MQERTLDDSKRPLRLRWIAIISAAVVISLPIAKYYVPISGWPRLAYALLLTITFSYGTDYLFRRQEARLAQRMQADAPPDRDVILNGVSVGHFTDAQYAEAQRTVLRRRLRRAAALEHGRQQSLTSLMTRRTTERRH